MAEARDLGRRPGLQPGQAADVSPGPARAATGAAVIFMLTSLTLTYFYSEPTTVMPATAPRAAQPTSPVPTETPAQMPTEVTQPGKVEQEQQAAPPAENPPAAPEAPRN